MDMWQTVTYAEGSSTPNEISLREDQTSSSTITEVNSNDETWSSSLSSFICYRIPVITTSYVPQILPTDTCTEMNSDISSPRYHDQSRQSCDNQRCHPYRIPHVFVNSNINHCSLQNCDEDSYRHFSTQDESSCAGSIKERDQCIERSLIIQQDIDDRSSPLTRDYTMAEDVNITTHYDQGSNSDDNLSLPLVQFHPPHAEPDSPEREIENHFQISYDSPNEKYIDPVSTLLLKSMSKLKSTRKETRKVKTSTIIDDDRHYFQQDDDLLEPLMRLIPELPLPTISAQQIANNLIRLSRYLKSPDPNELNCLDCSLIPILPVTGPCGHTRCMRCILLNGACPCGTNAPKPLYVNTIIREIVEKMAECIKSPRLIDPGSSVKSSEDKNNTITRGNLRRLMWLGLQTRNSRPTSKTKVYSSHRFSRPRLPMTIQARYRRAEKLISTGKFLEAAPHLARVAASTGPFARVARKLLAQTISSICQGRKKSIVSRKLSQCVREQSAFSWLRPSDLECVLCTNTFRNPVSTPCGHTYCRRCIERSLYYKKKCALCLGPLENFKLAETRDTAFLSSILTTINVSTLPDETNVIPVVTCYVAFPGMPCPLFIFHPRYWRMVQRVMESGSRKFGMLAYDKYDKGHIFADYGTILEICDCVVFEDNRCIVSTVGVSRFRVLERHEKDGCDMASIQIIHDMTPTEDEISDLHILATRISIKTLNWIKNMDEAVQDEIETAFGPLPYNETPDFWWKTSDGPNWLWWLIAILPLKPEIKILIVSTRSLIKRMLAVSRTLDAMELDSIASNASSEEPTNDFVNHE